MAKKKTAAKKVKRKAPAKKKPARKVPAKKKSKRKGKPRTKEQVRAARDKQIIKALKAKVFQGVPITRLVSLYYKVNPPTYTELTPIKRAFMEILSENLSNVSRTCRQTGVSRITYYDWLEKDAAFAAAVHETKESQIDWVEGNLLANVANGKEASAIFFLKTQGKERGYVESINVNIGAQKHAQALMELEALGLDKIIEMTIRERQVVQIEGESAK